MNDETQEKKTPFGLVLLTLAGIFVLAIVVNELTRNTSRPQGTEVAAIGALETLSSAQALFREADKEGDDVLDYGTLSELANSGTTGLIDRVLGSGTKQGYLFECTYGALTSAFIWIATASPASPGTTGDRYFMTNHEGVTYYTYSAPFVLNSIDCQIPPGVQPVGR